VKISLPLAKLEIAQLPLEVVTVISVELPPLGAVTLTVRLVVPDPVGPALTVVGRTETVQAELEETILIAIEAPCVTPVQENDHDCVVVEPGETVVDSAVGVMFPPHTVVAATVGIAMPRMESVPIRAARLRTSVLDVRMLL
jgi:hypothetical protein